jgi:hypothetical protein
MNARSMVVRECTCRASPQCGQMLEDTGIPNRKQHIMNTKFHKQSILTCSSVAAISAPNIYRHSMHSALQAICMGVMPI